MSSVPIDALVVMGVGGCGKSTVASLLAEQLGWTLIEADEHHSVENVEKMRGGEPLTDADRAPWLASLAAAIEQIAAKGQHAVVACSALKPSYRDALKFGRKRSASIWFVLLEPGKEELTQRLEARAAHGIHFMHQHLLQSQLDTLEYFPEQIWMHFTPRLESGMMLLPDEIAATILRRLKENGVR